MSKSLAESLPVSKKPGPWVSVLGFWARTNDDWVSSQDAAGLVPGEAYLRPKDGLYYVFMGSRANYVGEGGGRPKHPGVYLDGERFRVVPYPEGTTQRFLHGETLPMQHRMQSEVARAGVLRLGAPGTLGVPAEVPEGAVTPSTGYRRAGRGEKKLEIALKPSDSPKLSMVKNFVNELEIPWDAYMAAAKGGGEAAYNALWNPFYSLQSRPNVTDKTMQDMLRRLGFSLKHCIVDQDGNEVASCLEG